MDIPPVFWRPPPHKYVKINSDATFDLTTGKGFTGIVCRDEQGVILTAITRPFFALSPLIAEAISLRDAVSLACNLNLQTVILESDNKPLVEACRGNIQRVRSKV